MPLYMVEKKLDDLVLLDLRGRLILGQETADLRGRLGRLLDSGHLRIILKLEGVSYIDSAGLSTLLVAADITRLTIAKPCNILKPLTSPSYPFRSSAMTGPPRHWLLMERTVPRPAAHWR